MLDFPNSIVVAHRSGSGLVVSSSKHLVVSWSNRWSLIKQISSTRRMFEILRCKCPRCVAGRRNLCLAISGICVAIALAYLMITDRGETLPDSSLGGSGPLVSDSRLDRPQNASGGSEPLAAAKGEARAIKQQEPVVAEKLPDSSPEQEPSLDSASLNPATTILDESLAMVYSSHPFGVLPSWLGEREFNAPWRPQGGSAEKVKSVAGEPDSAIANRPGPAETPSSEPAIASSEPETDRPVLAGASPSGQENEAPAVEMVRPSEPIQPPGQQLKAPETITASGAKPPLPPRSKTAKYRKRE